ncbi:hypothetical protein SAMN04515647_2358 [Cohaesibacter sp. ES.047]|uniref:hypothetical protein n=1 Tax=Cohaesibacter sp. ES.047 TaxID=1798205 RepID=UPI000BB9A268|nr:hypothetical protein [Cohaesibacter sp. ES.047]SNY92111.1 hypothetical protein SAMN04515647_2358 [Cohaesibacter sp. ES.047]
MILIVRGRASEAPKPPQTKPQRRNFMVAVECASTADADEKATAFMKAGGYDFISVIGHLRVTGDLKDPVIADMVDKARRNGIGAAIYR